jgi:E3 ubiquitin-protein ligase HUWE1
MALVRKTIADVSDPQLSLPHSFAEALLSFATFIASHAAGGNMVVGAGLVPLLTQLVENKLPERLGVVSKTMQLVDNVLYSLQTPFSCSVRLAGWRFLSIG